MGRSHNSLGVARSSYFFACIFSRASALVAFDARNNTAYNDFVAELAKQHPTH